jgi:hypothetical protein
MAKPLRLFANSNTWSLIHGYGWEVPPPPTGSIFHNVMTLDTTGDGTFLAAGAGKLSVLAPGSSWVDAREPVSVLEPGEPLPDAIDLFLHLSPVVSADALFRLRAQPINNIAGFVYRNVETASLSVTLTTQLRFALFPTSSGVTDTKVAELLIAARVGVPVSAGDKIGKAFTVGAPAGSRRLGFGVITDCGPLDPSFTYDWMRDFVSDGQPAVDQFLAFAPKNWPIIDPDLSQTEAIDKTAADLYAFIVLNELANRSPPLTPAQWREVGNNQKALWHKRLLRRAGHALATDTDPPFEFNDIDYRNLFQLEAVVEFFANYPSPWRTGDVPRTRVASTLTGMAATVAGNVVTLDGAPDLSGITLTRDEIRLAGAGPPSVFQIAAVGASTVTVIGEPQLNSGASAWEIRILTPDYIDVDFLAPSGDAATVSGQVVTLDGISDLKRVKPNKDTLWLSGVPGQRTYRITAVDTVARTVTVAPAPVLIGTDSHWRINLRPILVLIDAFGARVKGKNASVQTPGVEAVLLLADATPAALQKVNAHFDTVYLPADNTGATRAYRILAKDFAGRTITVEGTPVFPDGKSDWYIQSGISGELPGAEGTLGPGGARGYDHYDGTLFVINGGQVINRFRWSSFTSRAAHTTVNQESSIRGNMLYRYSSLRASGNDWINYAFWVRNAEGAADPQPAAFFFRNPPTANTKTENMIHNGSADSSSGTGSGGCLVSPSFYQLREVLIDFDRDEHARLREAPDAGVEALCGMGRTKSENLYNSTSAQPQWDGKLTGALWLIRPDERPI